MSVDASAAPDLMLVRFAGTGRTLYPLAAAAELAGVHPDLLRHYCHLGLLGDERTEPGAAGWFDDDALYEVRRIENFRGQLGVNLSALPLVCAMAREIDRLHAELRFRRDR